MPLIPHVIPRVLPVRHAHRPSLRRALTFVAWALCLGCGVSRPLEGPEEAGAQPPDASGSPWCSAFTSATALGRLEVPGLAETSGLAASRKNPGVLWAHNDSGDAARVFALTPQGKPLGAYRLAGAAAVDWEDMAIGPVPGRNGDFLYLGDIGNNNGAKRQTVRIYRVAEPKVSANQEPGSYDLTGWEAIDLRYPAEPSDAEALLVDPRSGDLFIVTKNFNGPSYVFHAPAVGRPGGVVPLTALGPVHFGVRGTPIITGGSVLETGEAILLRAYTEILLWHRSDGASLGETLTKTAPCLVPAPLELQGEAVAFAPGGRGYYTIAEGRRAMVHFVAHR